MPTVQEACCSSKDDCLKDVTEELPPLGLVAGTPVLIMSTIKCAGMSADDAKENVIKSARCNFWCQIFFGLIMFIVWMINSGPVMAGLQNFIMAVVSAFLSLWFLRCCLALEDKCWWLVLVIWFGISLGLVVFGGFGLFSVDAISAIIYLTMAFPSYTMFIYGLRYYMANSWDGAGKADAAASEAV